MSIDRDMQASIAVTRFGLGARPGEIASARTDPVAFLRAQIRQEGADQPVGALSTGAANFVEVRQYQQMRRQAGANGADAAKQVEAEIRKAAQPEFLARAQLACQTDDGFRERWALFWCNHFTVAAKNLETSVLAGPFEREAIRPNVFGRFEDLLVASTSHPGMLLYLDQAQSAGPNSMAAQRFLAAQTTGGEARLGLNENLAREILELHTLGVGSGYTQADVTEFARALTGWTIQGPDAARFAGPVATVAQPGAFIFRPAMHEPGPRQILGKTYAMQGEAQARAVLRDVAANPATAHHLATKIARHFVADDPPPALVARLERAYLRSDGRLDQVAETLIEAPEAWAPEQRKFKTPYEFLVSSYRAMDQAPQDFIKFGPVLAGLGQPPFNAPSPKGWAEEAQDWAAPDAIIKRMDWSEAFAAAAAAPVMGDPRQIAETTLGAQLTAPASLAVSRAETRSEALSILLMSPEFQRR